MKTVSPALAVVAASSECKTVLDVAERSAISNVFLGEARGLLFAIWQEVPPLNTCLRMRIANGFCPKIFMPDLELTRRLNPSTGSGGKNPNRFSIQRTGKSNLKRMRSFIEMISSRERQLRIRKNLETDKITDSLFALDNL